MDAIAEGEETVVMLCCCLLFTVGASGGGVLAVWFRGPIDFLGYDAVLVGATRVDRVFQDRASHASHACSHNVVKARTE